MITNIAIFPSWNTFTQVTTWPWCTHKKQSHNQLLNRISPSTEVRTLLESTTLFLSEEGSLWPVFFRSKNGHKFHPRKMIEAKIISFWWHSHIHVVTDLSSCWGEGHANTVSSYYLHRCWQGRKSGLEVQKAKNKTKQKHKTRL